VHVILSEIALAGFDGRCRLEGTITIDTVAGASGCDDKDNTVRRARIRLRAERTAGFTQC
jgi:hypothetical protein